jgi:hypothetical protein
MVMESLSRAFTTPRMVSPLVSVRVTVVPDWSGVLGLAGGGATGWGAGCCAACASGGGTTCAWADPRASVSAEPAAKKREYAECVTPIRMRASYRER